MHPVLRLIGPVPAVAWIPIAFFVFPSSRSASTFLIALATFFPVAVLTWSGVAAVRRRYYDVARTMGARPWFLVRKVAVPAAMPSVFVGLFMGLGASFSVLVVAEMLGVKAGLGWYMQWAQGWAAYANMYVALLVMALMCTALDHPAVPRTRRVAVLAEGAGAVVSARASAPGARRGGSSATPSPSTGETCRCWTGSLSAGPGEFVAILGPSRLRQVHAAAPGRGAGAADAGQRARDGAEVTGPDPSRVLMFQDPTLYPWRTVRANVGLGLEARGELRRLRAPGGRGACAWSGWNGFDDRVPAPDLRRHGAARRARPCAGQRPGVLMLDEPLGKLDSLTRLQMQRELVRHVAGPRLHRSAGHARRGGGAADGRAASSWSATVPPASARRSP